MIYIHKITGAIIDSPCVISGGDWIEHADMDQGNASSSIETIENKQLNNGTEVTNIESEGDTNPDSDKTSGLDSIAKKDIMQELDALGIKYNPKSTKKALYDLMMKGK